MSMAVRSVEAANLGDQLALHVAHLRRQRVALAGESGVEAVDLLVDTHAPHSISLARHRQCHE
ncbi:MAG TPA: hypothetical protein VF136_17765 [Methylomirabilota bacterium]